MKTISSFVLAGLVAILLPSAVVQAQPAPNKNIVKVKQVDKNQSIWGTIFGLPF